MDISGLLFVSLISMATADKIISPNRARTMMQCSSLGCTTHSNRRWTVAIS